MDIPDNLNLTIVRYIRLPEHTYDEALLEAKTHSAVYQKPVYLYEDPVENIFHLTCLDLSVEPAMSYTKVMPNGGMEYRHVSKYQREK